jgi:hypothetical protein
MIGVNGVHDSAESKSGNTFSDPHNAHTDYGGVSEAYYCFTFPPEDIWRSCKIFFKVIFYTRTRKKRRKAHEEQPRYYKSQERKITCNQKIFINNLIQKLLIGTNQKFSSSNFASYKFSISTLINPKNPIFSAIFAVISNDNFQYNLWR